VVVARRATVRLPQPRAIRKPARPSASPWTAAWISERGADVIAAATKAADTARERTAQYLLTTGLEQLREQATARTETAAAAPGTDRLPRLVARPLDNDATQAVIA
jgi:hypothetical protein